MLVSGYQELDVVLLASNSKMPNMNPPLPPAYETSETNKTDVLTPDIGSVNINNLNRNNRTKYNLRPRN